MSVIVNNHNIDYPSIKGILLPMICTPIDKKYKNQSLSESHFQLSFMITYYSNSSAKLLLPINQVAPLFTLRDPF